MAQENLDEFFLDEDEGVFDPLADDFGPAQDGVDPDEDGIVDLPVMAEMPEEVKVKSVFDKDRFACAQDAIEELLHRNPGRKPVFLQIIEFCCDEHTSEEVAQLVEQAQAENRSVYTSQSLCTILERAGALVSRTEEPETSEEQGDLAAEQGCDGEAEAHMPAAHPTTYWISTDEGLTVLAAHREGSALEELLTSDTESVYLPVYERVLAFCAQEPRTKPQIDAIVDDDPLVQRPRRYSNHFIELLENREALSWHDGGWNATDLGRRYLEKHGIAAE